MPTHQEVRFASDGDTCAAWMYRPEGATEPVPCVVMAHGFSATRADRLPAYAERFAAAGLAVLLFDYRHFGDSGGEPRQVLEIGRQLDDYPAAIAFAKSQAPPRTRRSRRWSPTVAAVGARNALRGTVLGIADQLGALAGRPPRMLPAVGPPGSFAAMTAPEAEPGFAAITAPGSRWRNEVAARVMLHVAQYRPVSRAPRVHCPLLVAVCDRDRTTPPAAAVKLAARAPRGELVRYPIGHFDIYVGEDFERALADQAAFLERHLARVAAPAAG